MNKYLDICPPSTARLILWNGNTSQKDLEHQHRCYQNSRCYFLVETDKVILESYLFSGFQICQKYSLINLKALGGYDY